MRFTVMDLLEYQAKELFRQMGIPVLPSQRIDHPRDLKGLKIPYPVVLKSQVYAGGRAKAGGIRFVENTIDAVAAAQTIFNLEITGQYPEVLLAEAKYEPDQELYLAVVLDRSSRRPLLLGSAAGGIEVEAAVEQMQQVIVDQEFSPFFARRLAILMGLQGGLIQSVSSILEKMYWLFVHKDLDLVEINPLAIGSKGEVMALDGKVTANHDALGRHPDLLQLRSEMPRRGDKQIASKGGLNLIKLDGSIGILCNGAGLMMAALDLVSKAGGKPGSSVNVGGEFRHDSPPSTLSQRIEQGLDLIAQEKNLKVILVNILGNVVPCTQIAEAIAHYLTRRAATNSPVPPIVVRLLGQQFDQAKETLETVNVPLVDNLDRAIAQVITLSKSKVS